MAVMVPESCPGRATSGEKWLFNFFRDWLPDDFTVWYEPVIQGRYPDFTILSDSFGLIVLEVKAWSLSQIHSADDESVEIVVSDGEPMLTERRKNPLRQVREYAFQLIDLLKGQPILRNPSGDHQGKLCFPYSYGVVFLDITKDDLERSELSRLFPTERVICRNELSELARAKDLKGTVARLGELFHDRFDFEPLTADQLSTAKGVIHPDVIISKNYARIESVPPSWPFPQGAKILEVLDREQESAALSLGEGHRIVVGVAGSGKTVMLIARAKILASQDPTKRVLVLCYNKALATYLKSQLLKDHVYKNIDVRTFHSWAVKTSGLKRRKTEELEDFLERCVKLLVDLGKRPNTEAWDAILIDEAHDFEPEWFRCCTNALKEDPTGDLVIVIDGAQSLYGRPCKFTWKSVGVIAPGRVRRLRKNYRNTAEILDFAWEITQALIPSEPEDGEGTESAISERLPPEEVVRRGAKPAFRACSTTDEEHEAVTDCIDLMLGEGIPREEICVLYPGHDRGRVFKLLRRMRSQGQVWWVNDPTIRVPQDGGITLPGVRLSTIHSAKGLEFRAVILSSLDLLPRQNGNADPVRDSNLLYVGLTRAQERLIVTWAGESEFTRRVAGSTKCIQI
jgi:hypothetical protein